MACWARLSSSAHSPCLPGDMWPKCSFHPISVTSSYKKRQKHKTLHKILDKLLALKKIFPLTSVTLNEGLSAHFETLSSSSETVDTKKIAPSGIHTEPLVP